MTVNSARSWPRRLGQLAGLSLLLVFISLLYGLEPVQAARVSDIRGTKHNLSAAADGSGYNNPTAGDGTVPARNIKASSETQLCVFCHTPHGAATGATPLWNRKVAGEGYTQSYVLYDSNTLDAKQVQGSLEQPGGSSKLCLSCHDGTVAVGNVNVLNGTSPTPNPTTTSTIATSGGPNMPVGSGTTTGFTRNLGTNLSNDHPISVSYNETLVFRDGELRSPTANPTLIGVRSPGNKPKLKLENTGTPGPNQAQVQCATCHDPHIRETDSSVGNQKFLRLNRFQQKTHTVAPSGFDPADNTGDIICLSCHDKGGASWLFSAHANSQVADETYKATPATQREFPTALPVWKAACLNCHDTHTVQGARRLLREGTDSASSPKAGGNPALEQVCYQCHTTTAESIVTTVSGGAPDIKSDFALGRAMPITVGSPEVHDPNSTANLTAFNLDCTQAGTQCGKDLVESRENLGLNNLSNRHAECTDCHNPHRVIRSRTGLPGALTAANTQATKQNGASGGAHDHRNATGYIHNNVISGVLRGAWGVEPTYGSASFHALPTGYTIKRGDPGSSTATDAGQSYVTREYQICLKCHSDFAYFDDNTYPSGNTRPLLGAPGTAANANGHTNFTRYTNQAKEFQAPAAHAVAVGGASLGNAAGTGTAASNNNNHRSWHPVMAPTGRTGRSGSWIAPWNNSGTGGQAGRLGVQTMYCTDCHGSNTATATAIPDTDKPWGPHGSANNFLLKGPWDTGSGEGNANTLCFKCHSQSAYSGGGGTGWSTDRGDGHSVHSDKIDNPLRCNWCHVAVPHGWKNRNLLVNLLDVGAEAGLAPGTAVSFTNNVGYTNGPYYRRAFLRVISFPAAGSQWRESNCNGGSKDTMKNNCETAN